MDLKLSATDAHALQRQVRQNLFGKAIRHAQQQVQRAKGKRQAICAEAKTIYFPEAEPDHLAVRLTMVLSANNSVALKAAGLQSFETILKTLLENAQANLASAALTEQTCTIASASNSDLTAAGPLALKIKLKGQAFDPFILKWAERILSHACKKLVGKHAGAKADCEKDTITLIGMASASPLFNLLEETFCLIRQTADSSDLDSPPPEPAKTTGERELIREQLMHDLNKVIAENNAWATVSNRQPRDESAYLEVSVRDDEENWLGVQQVIAKIKELFKEKRILTR